MFGEIFGSRTRIGKRRSQSHHRSDAQLGLEQLERRLLLSTINWTNRGTSQVDSDLFGATYGAAAETARAIVTQAINDWSRAIDNFNYNNPGQPGYAFQANTFNLSVFATELGGRTRGSAPFNMMRLDPDGKPFQATVFMDNDGGGSGWYFDPVPDNAEFTTLASRYQSAFTGPGSQVDDDDFYRTILHEMGHTMGLSTSTVNFLEARGIDQVDGTSQLFLFSRNGVTASFTANGGGHLYEGNADPAFPLDPSHPNELLNPGRTISAPPTTRQLISDLDVQILRAAYGYSVVLPSTTETFLANLNATTGALTVSGDPQTVNNSIILSTIGSGQTLRVNVNGVISHWPKFAVNSIMVNTGSGIDTIDLRASFPGVPVVINSGDAGDILKVASNLGTTVNVNGGNGSDYLIVENSTRPSVGDFAAGVFSINTDGQNTVGFYSSIERLAVNGDRNDAVRINATRPETPVSVIGVGTVAIPRFDVSTGPVNVSGRNATFLTITDASLSASDFQVGRDSVVATIGGIIRTVDFDELRSLTINGGGGGNTFTVTGTHAASLVLNTGLGMDRTFVQASSGPVIINGQAGRDDVGIGLAGSVRNIGGTLSVENTGSFTAVSVVNSADAIPRTAILYKSGAFHVLSGLTPGGDIVLRGRSLRSLVIRTGNGGNTFRIHDTPKSNWTGGVVTTIDTGRGSDLVNVNGTSGPLVVNGQGGQDTVNLGASGTVRNIAKAVYVNNAGGSSTVNVDNSADAIARTTIVYRNGPDSVISGLTPGGDIVLRSDELRSLTIRTGLGGNFFRVHDTPAAVTTSIFAGAGNDRIDVDGTRGPLAINVQGGSNNIFVGTANASLDTIQGAIQLTGPGGGNTVRIDDRRSTANEVLTHTITATSYLRSGAALVTLSDVGNFSLVAGAAADTINIQGRMTPHIGALSNYSIFAGAGHDVMNLGSVTNLLAGFGTMTLTGEGGVDALNIHDQGSTTAKSYAIDLVLGIQPYFASNDATFLHSGLENTRLRGGSGGNTVRVKGTAAGSSHLVESGSGSDTVIVGTDAGSLANLHGQLSLDGQDGLDQATFNDQARAAAENYSFYPGAISTTFAATDFLYSAIEALSVNGSAGVNNFGFSYDPGPSDPAISLNGGGGSNQLAGPHVPNLWQITGANSGMLNTNITFTSMQSIYGGQDDDRFNVSAGAGVDGSINGLGGVNTLDYSAYAGNLGRAAQLDQNLGLYATDDLYENFYGHGERWVIDTSAQWYFILPDGRLYRDDAGAAGLPPASLVATLDPSFHNDIVRLVNARHVYAGGLDQDPFGPLATQLDRDLNLNATDNLFYNWGGKNERWVVGGEYPTDFDWYFILPNGELHLWDGTQSSASGPLVATLDATFHEDISKLVDAQFLFNGDFGDSLVAWYTAEQNFNDIVGGNNGTQVGGVSFDPGRIGYAFSFDDNYVSVPNAPELEPATVSVEAWVNSWIGGQDNRYILAKGADGNTAASYALYTGAGGGLSFYVYDGELNYAVSPAAGAEIWDDTWHHVVGTYDGTTVRLYVDGVEIGDGTPSNLSIGYGLSDSNDLYLGAYPGPSLLSFVGRVDEPSIYNRALSADEALRLFTHGKSLLAAGEGVTVNLQLGTATGLTGGIANIQNVFGSDGNDLLVGNGGNVLNGGAGRDLLIAGAFASVLNGGGDDDLLIAGTTDYDGNQAALGEIMAEWTSTRNYATRVANLTGGLGVPLLNSSTVRSNGGGNTLDGHGGLDLFFASLNGLDVLNGDLLTETFVGI
jgi:Concanavalin A-like lectin/glucanases superfamily